MAIKRHLARIEVDGVEHYAEVQISEGDRTDFENGDPFAIAYVRTMILEYKPHYADLEFDETNVSFDD